MVLTPIGEWIIVGSFVVTLILWALAIGVAIHNDRLDGPSPY